MTTAQAAKAVVDVTPYQLFMLALCIFALSLLGANTFSPPDPATATILQYADNLVCLLFLADFLHSLWRAPNRWRYMVTWGWLDLLSSIPAIDALRLGRAARLLRILRLLRAIRSVRVLGQFIISRRGESVGLAATLAVLLLLTFCSLAILNVEGPAGGNIQTAEDAMWWSITTLTTVGYGDRFPTTSEGRAIAAVLMVSGLGLVGVLSGLMAGWFLSPAARVAETEREELKNLIVRLQQQLATGEADRGWSAGLIPTRPPADH